MKRVRSVDEVEGASEVDTEDVEEVDMGGLKNGTMIDEKGMIGTGEITDVVTEMKEGMIDGIGIMMIEGTVIEMREGTGTGMIGEREIVTTDQGIEIGNVKTEETEIERTGANDARMIEGRNTTRTRVLRMRKRRMMLQNLRTPNGKIQIENISVAESVQMADMNDVIDVAMKATRKMTIAEAVAMMIEDETTTADETDAMMTDTVVAAVMMTMTAVSHAEITTKTKQTMNPTDLANLLKMRRILLVIRVPVIVDLQALLHHHLVPRLAVDDLPWPHRRVTPATPDRHPVLAPHPHPGPRISTAISHVIAPPRHLSRAKSLLPLREDGIVLEGRSERRRGILVPVNPAGAGQGVRIVKTKAMKGG